MPSSWRSPLQRESHDITEHLKAELLARNTKVLDMQAQMQQVRRQGQAGRRAQSRHVGAPGAAAAPCQSPSLPSTSPHPPQMAIDKRNFEAALQAEADALKAQLHAEAAAAAEKQAAQLQALQQQLENVAVFQRRQVRTPPPATSPPPCLYPGRVPAPPAALPLLPALPTPQPCSSAAALRTPEAPARTLAEKIMVPPRRGSWWAAELGDAGCCRSRWSTR